MTESTQTIITKKGFTLVELAIVLVIIGLLVGGVLAGQELINQAKIRKVTSTISEYDTAVNTFRTKYSGIPGDFNKAQEFGIDTNFSDTDGNTVGVQTNGDGNGLVENAPDGNNNGNLTCFYGENANMFAGLSNTSLIKGSYDEREVDRDLSYFAHAGISYPALPMGTGMIVASSKGINHYLIGVNNGFDACTLGNDPSLVAQYYNNGTNALALNLTPEQAYSIDSKLDDGKPNAGTVLATSGVDTISNISYGSSGYIPQAFHTANGATSSDCANGIVAGSDYNLAYRSGACSITIRASW